MYPTQDPTLSPTNTLPTRSPDIEPTRPPTPLPTRPPTRLPTPRPTRRPTPPPTDRPGRTPTRNPTTRPSAPPTTNKPTNGAPTQKPSRMPVVAGVGFEWGAIGPLGQTQPEPAKFQGGLPIIDIAAGPRYTLFVDDEGNAFASGYVEAPAEYRGQFGVGDVTQGSNNDRPVSIVVRNGVPGKAPPFQRVQAGSDHSAFIDVNGQVYTTGSNNDGKLCLGDNDGGMKEYPHLVTLPSNRVAVSVSLGLEFTLILLDNGEVYGCGSNRLGQIGLGDTVFVSKPTLTGKSLGKIKDISAGAEFSLFLTEDVALTEVRRAYSTGSNLYQQQCRDTGGNPVKTPTEINNQGLSVLVIQASRSSSYLLLTAGSGLRGIASCGRNNEGQLCGSVVDAKAQVKLDPSILPTGFGSGPTAQTVFFIGVNATDGSDVVYGCGQNDLDQVGIGSNQPARIDTPKKLDFLGIKRFRMKISASTTHTVAIDTSSPTPTTPSPTSE